MYHSTLRNTIFLLLTGYTLIASGFVPPMATSLSQSVGTTTLLSARRWNFNDGQAPWGLKQNAEIWNGRVAQVKEGKLQRLWLCSFSILPWSNREGCHSIMFVCFTLLFLL